MEQQNFEEQSVSLWKNRPESSYNVYGDAQGWFKRLLELMVVLILSKHGEEMASAFLFEELAKRLERADPQNIQEVAASQLVIINSYYQSGLRQSQQSFHWSLIWGGVGFGFLVVAVSVLLFRQPAQVALASGIAGALVEVFAGTYLYLYKHASDQLAAFRTSLESTQRLLLANSMCEKLEGELGQTTRAELIGLMVRSAVKS